MRVLEFTVYRRRRLRSAAYPMRDSLLEYVRGSPKPPLWHCSSLTQKSMGADEGFSSLSRIPCWSIVVPEIRTLLHSVTKNPNPFSKVRSHRDATPPERGITTLLETSAVYTALAEVLYSSIRTASPMSTSAFADTGRLPGDICSSELVSTPGLSFEGIHSLFKAAILVNWEPNTTSANTGYLLSKEDPAGWQATLLKKRLCFPLGSSLLADSSLMLSLGWLHALLPNLCGARAPRFEHRGHFGGRIHARAFCSSLHTKRKVR